MRALSCFLLIASLLNVSLRLEAQDRVTVPASMGDGVTKGSLSDWLDGRAKRGDEARKPVLRVGREMKVDEVGIMPYAFDPAAPAPFIETFAAKVFDGTAMAVRADIYGIERSVRTRGGRQFVGPPRPELKHSILLMVRDVSTAGIADDAQIRLPGSYIVAGTEKLGTANGEKTVYSLKPFDIQLP